VSGLRSPVIDIRKKGDRVGSYYFLPEMITCTNTAKARIMLTVGLLTISGMVLDASMGVDVGVDSIAVCLLLAGTLFAWGTCAIA
jgi:hypothetical protein